VPLPELNWPGDLFTDVSTRAVEPFLPQSATAPALWMDLMDSWAGPYVIPERQWNVPSLEPELTAILHAR
jgi:hypothetical protein